VGFEESSYTWSVRLSFFSSVSHPVLFCSSFDWLFSYLVNQLSEIPPQIASLVGLEKLDISGNRNITKLDAFVADLSQLTSLNASQCPLGTYSLAASLFIVWHSFLTLFCWIIFRWHFYFPNIKVGQLARTLSFGMQSPKNTIRDWSIDQTCCSRLEH
jgi:hypothetical protein